MHIVIVNDDGVHAGGILALARETARTHRVTVVAPDRERSATSHSITLDHPLTVREIHHASMPDTRFYSVNGTPVDCVHMARALAGDDIDLLVSGINNGANLGGDVSYSGTVHAALEAASLGLPAIALSLRIAPHEMRRDAAVEFEIAARMGAQIIRSISPDGLGGLVYNINFPTDTENCPPEVKVCPQGISVYSSVFQKQADPFGREVYWLYAVDNENDYNEMHRTDVYWSNRGYATCTPMTWNATAFDAMERTDACFAGIRLGGAHHDSGCS